MQSETAPRARRTNLLVEAARLYYDHGFSQARIAIRLGISRPTVSRILRSARDAGIVRIEICDPLQRGTRLEDALQANFALKKAVVVPHDGEDDAALKRRLGGAAARLLDRLLAPGATLGVSWGTTMQALADRLLARPVEGMTVVQLNGGISRAECDTHASEIAQKMGASFAAVPFLLPLPAVVEHADVKRAIDSDKHIARTLALARSADVCVFTVGSFGPESILVKADYFEPTEVDALLARGAVGDICSRIIARDGTICSPELDARTIGIELHELKRKPHAIAVAGGREKLPAIRAALAGRWFNTLVTDEWVAGRLLGEEV